MPDRAVVYTYAACDTCRKAIKWLRAQRIAFEERPIRETPPSVEELKQMLTFHEGDRKRLFNTAGRDYRALGLAEKLPELSEGEALALLAANGNLVKRPFLLSQRVGLVGFDERSWQTALPRSE